ncbi:MAG: prolipoprotein diacylglyceryl transferase [Firmicutes bacterium HGW-Firmicutes-18]|nr:MAG: prolipoprotein diacylglyceryl transferase [Firmicutes bacterium HGW-Firmicutes-18]
MKYPVIGPVLIHLGPLQIRWYGLMYVIGFVLAYFIMKKVAKNRDYSLEQQDIEDLVAYCILGLVIGARIGYCFFYNFSYYIYHPFKIIAVWEGGMSLHGGLIGVLIVGWLFSIKRKKSFLMLADLGAVAATPGLFFGRMGNFINAELYGRITNVPWGMVFPGAGPFPRHPSQIYEAFFEGIVLFFIMYILSRRKSVHGTLIGSFLIIYGIMRFFIEFFREPDPQIGFILGIFSMGQVLCIIMITIGSFLFWYVQMQGISEHNKKQISRLKG